MMMTTSAKSMRVMVAAVFALSFTASPSFADQDAPPAETASPGFENEPPPWRPSLGPVDATMFIARTAPLEWQATLLLGVDILAPVLLALGPALVGGVAGFALAGLPVPSISNGAPTVVLGAGSLPGAAVGALVAGGATLFMLDVVFNTFHLGRLAPARLVGLGIMMPPAILAMTYALWLTTPHPQVPAAVDAALLAGTLMAVGLNFTVLPLVALTTSAFVRAYVDYEEGSPLWTREERPAAQ
ncbi:MAG: hypothetical protein AB2A00_09330 [Myxococcota bacterium]